MILNEYTIKKLERKLSKLLNEELHIVDDETNDTICITEETLPSVIDSLFKK